MTEEELINHVLNTPPENRRRAEFIRDIVMPILRVDSAEDFAASMSALAFGLHYVLLTHGRPEGYERLFETFISEVRLAKQDYDSLRASTGPKALNQESSS